MTSFRPAAGVPDAPAAAFQAARRPPPPGRLGLAREARVGGLGPRSVEVLKALSMVSPAPFAELERLAPALLPSLAGLRSAHRLLYRELSRLQHAGQVATRRLPLAAGGVFYPTPRGVALLRCLGLLEVPDDSLARYLAFPEHEALLRRLRAALLLARFADAGRLTELAWNDRARFDVTVGGAAAAYEPDGLYRLTPRDGRAVSAFVELDRGTKALSVWTAKMKKADGPLRTAGHPTRLLIVALGARRLRSLTEVASECLRGNPAAIRGLLASELTPESVLAQAL